MRVERCIVTLQNHTENALAPSLRDRGEVELAHSVAQVIKGTAEGSEDRSGIFGSAGNIVRRVIRIHD